MKIVFLDIDGVLQPYDSCNRFYAIDKNTNKLIDRLSEEHNTDYRQYNVYDVLAVYYDWHPQAIDRLKYVLDSTESKIIASTDWRKKGFPNKIPDLLKIHGLNKYWFADNIIIEGLTSLHEIRSLEIQDSLNKYPIDNFIILDDMKKLKDYFPNNTIITKDHLSISDMNDAIKILKKTR